MMNKFEYLYQKKQLLEKEIAKNDLFKLCTKDAIQCVMVKVRMLYSYFNAGEHNKKQQYIKQLIKTNATNVDEITFFQESLKWICRWCSEYCVVESNYSGEIFADQVYELMGLAYAYNEFVKFSFYHSKHIVNYNVYGNYIQFEHINEESYQVHELYNTWIRKNTEKREYWNCLTKCSTKSGFEMMEVIHRSDFNFNYNFKFGKFTLKDYEEVSVALNNYVIGKMSNNLMIPGIAGVSVWKKKDLVKMLVQESGIDEEKVEEMITFFRYNTEDKNADLSLNYFLELDGGRILFSEAIFHMQRPATNALRILAKCKSELYDKEQNMFEKEQKNRIKKMVEKRFLVANNFTKAQSIRSGMDMLVYDKKNNHLQVIELKYKIPVESEMDITNLDKMLGKAYTQLTLAKKYVGEHEEILEEYFGSEYIGITPKEVDYFVITNYEIGTGVNCQLPSPILLENHYMQLMQQEDGMKLVQKVLRDKKKGMGGEIRKRYSRFSLIDFKIKIPETLMRLSGDIEQNLMI